MSCKEYLFLPMFVFDRINLCGEYVDWLTDWLYELNENIEKECVSSSECVQGLLCEAVMGKMSIDWRSVEKTYLRDEDNKPLAYSEKYGEKLYQFASQWKQTPVHAVYNSFWITKYYDKDKENLSEDILEYASLIRELIQRNGWIYNPDVSNTQIRTRMRSELMMSMAMGTEILKISGITDGEKNLLEAAMAEVPLTGYVSAEFFRKRALENIERIYQYPEGLKDMLKKCEAGEGYNDFSIADKVDDYMGTKKRTQHDNAIHTPLISCMAYSLSCLGEIGLRNTVEDRMKTYAKLLRKMPLGIPAFRMRDIEYPFGSGITPLEVLSAASIMNHFGKEGN